MEKIATTKKLMEEEDVTVYEAERWLDADAFLDEYLHWGHCRLYHLYLMHQMFGHAVATGWKEHNWAIHQHWQQPSPEWDLGAEPFAMDLIGPGMSWAKIRVIYNDVYQS